MEQIFEELKLALPHMSEQELQANMLVLRQAMELIQLETARRYIAEQHRIAESWRKAKLN